MIGRGEKVFNICWAIFVLFCAYLIIFWMLFRVFTAPAPVEWPVEGKARIERLMKKHGVEVVVVRWDGTMWFERNGQWCRFK